MLTQEGEACSVHVSCSVCPKTTSLDFAAHVIFPIVARMDSYHHSGQSLKNEKRRNILLVTNESVRVSYMYSMNECTKQVGNWRISLFYVLYSIILILPWYMQLCSPLQPQLVLPGFVLAVSLGLVVKHLIVADTISHLHLLGICWVLRYAGFFVDFLSLRFYHKTMDFRDRILSEAAKIGIFLYLGIDILFTLK